MVFCLKSISTRPVWENLPTWPSSQHPGWRSVYCTKQQKRKKATGCWTTPRLLEPPPSISFSRHRKQAGRNPPQALTGLTLPILCLKYPAFVWNNPLLPIEPHAPLVPNNNLPFWNNLKSTALKTDFETDLGTFDGLEIQKKYIKLLCTCCFMTCLCGSRRLFFPSNLVTCSLLRTLTAVPPLRQN